eukprot:GHVS01086367.1.p1 GENE.GHVS01086367.1~~GHVS01086367.1.p1  ORF type:complete len:864 (+),score=205.17 GHVS01086367.1:342-2933(+)
MFCVAVNRQKEHPIIYEEKYPMNQPILSNASPANDTQSSPRPSSSYDIPSPLNSSPSISFLTPFSCIPAALLPHTVPIFITLPVTIPYAFVLKPYPSCLPSSSSLPHYSPHPPPPCKQTFYAMSARHFPTAHALFAHTGGISDTFAANLQLEAAILRVPGALIPLVGTLFNAVCKRYLPALEQPLSVSCGCLRERLAHGRKRGKVHTVRCVVEGSGGGERMGGGGGDAAGTTPLTEKVAAAIGSSSENIGGTSSSNRWRYEQLASFMCCLREHLEALLLTYYAGRLCVKPFMREGEKHNRSSYSSWGESACRWTCACSECAAASPSVSTCASTVATPPPPPTVDSSSCRGVSSPPPAPTASSTTSSVLPFSNHFSSSPSAAAAAAFSSSASSSPLLSSTASYQHNTWRCTCDSNGSVDMTLRVFNNNPIPPQLLRRCQASWATGLEVGEIRLTTTKPNQLLDTDQVDPRFPGEYIRTRPILRDLSRDICRHVFAPVHTPPVLDVAADQLHLIDQALDMSATTPCYSTSSLDTTPRPSSTCHGGGGGASCGRSDMRINCETTDSSYSHSVLCHSCCCSLSTTADWSTTTTPATTTNPVGSTIVHQPSHQQRHFDSPTATTTGDLCHSLLSQTPTSCVPPTSSELLTSNSVDLDLLERICEVATTLSHPESSPTTTPDAHVVSLLVRLLTSMLATSEPPPHSSPSSTAPSFLPPLPPNPNNSRVSSLDHPPGFTNSAAPNRSSPSVLSSSSPCSPPSRSSAAYPFLPSPTSPTLSHIDRSFVSTTFPPPHHSSCCDAASTDPCLTTRCQPSSSSPSRVICSPSKASLTRRSHGRERKGGDSSRRRDENEARTNMTTGTYMQRRFE